MGRDVAVVGVTGHRPGKLGGHTRETWQQTRVLARRVLRELSPDAVLTGVALGWDLAIASACDNLGVPFTAAVPFVGQESRWPPRAQDLYASLLSKASKVVVVTGGGYAPWKMQRRNEWIVDNCDLLAALWDGSPGGTANCVGYANAVRRPVRNFWSLRNVS